MISAPEKTFRIIRLIRSAQFTPLSTSVNQRYVRRCFTTYRGLGSIVRCFLVSVVLSRYVASLSAQVAKHDTKLPNLPQTVGRYSREITKRPRASRGEQIYQYFDGTSTRVEVMTSDYSPLRSGTLSQVLRRRVEGVKSVLLANRRSGLYDDYVIAVDGFHTDTLGTFPILGYRVVAVVRQHDRIRLAFFCAYALRGSIIQIRALIPQADWQASDVPAFADKLVSELGKVI